MSTVTRLSIWLIFRSGNKNKSSDQPTRAGLMDKTHHQKRPCFAFWPFFLVYLHMDPTTSKIFGFWPLTSCTTITFIAVRRQWHHAHVGPPTFSSTDPTLPLLFMCVLHLEHSFSAQLMWETCAVFARLRASQHVRKPFIQCTSHKAGLTPWPATRRNTETLSNPN